MTPATRNEMETFNRSGHTEWIAGRSPYFIARRSDGDELWQSNRPFGVNDMIYKFPAGYTPSIEDVDELLYKSGR
jgi:hypothetical protein